MNIALLGYGKMGKRIDQLATQRGHQVLLKLGSRTSLSEVDFSGVDIAIEFSSPHSAFQNIQAAIQNHIPVVSGSTGWLTQLKDIEELTLKNNTAFLYASNFSLGVNAVFAINKKLAAILADNTSYDVSIEEIHHTTKKDAPSGTAISLAEQIVANCNKYDSWELDGKTNSKIPITAKRSDDVPGTHHIVYDSNEDVIHISHEAKNRDGFALGAILAAEFLVDKKGIFQMSEVLGI